MNNEEMKKQADYAAQTLAKSLLSTRNIIRILVIALFLWYFSTAILWVIGKITPLILLVVFAIFLAYLLDPLVDLIERPFVVRGLRKWMPRPLAIAIVYLAIFGAIGLSLSILLPKLTDQVTAFAAQVPSYKTALQERANKLKVRYETSIPPAVREKINKKIVDGIEELGAYIGSHAPTFLGEILLKILEYLPWLILVPILAFFLLKDASSFHTLAVQAFPMGVWRVRAEDFFQDVNKTLAAYIRAQLIACFLIGVVCFIGFYFIDLPYALLLGVIAGVLEFIPLVGPLIVAIIVGSLASYYDPKQALTVLVFLAVLRIVHDYVTYPRIIREGIHLHPIAIILAILGGTELAGITGVFLAIPVVALVTVAYRHYVKSRGGTGLVADILQEEDLLVVAAAGNTETIMAINVVEVEVKANEDG